VEKAAVAVRQDKIDFPLVLVAVVPKADARREVRFRSEFMEVSFAFPGKAKHGTGKRSSWFSGKSIL
jgi:hypothetical protein